MPAYVRDIPQPHAARLHFSVSLSRTFPVAFSIFQLHNLCSDCSIWKDGVLTITVQLLLLPLQGM